MSEHPLLKSDSDKDRLPPGQEDREDFPIDSKGPVPDWPEDWELRVFGAVEEEKFFSLSDLKSFSEVFSQRQDFHCVTGWSKLGVEWTGIRFEDLLDKVNLSEDAEHVMFHSLDGYSTNLPLEVSMGDDVLIVWELEGEAIPPKHGGKVRTVIESKYAYKSAKWLSEIEIMKTHEKGYYENRGYSDTADPWEEDRYV